MRKIDKPTYDVEEIVNECSESIRDKEKRNNFKACATYIAQQSDTYNDLAMRQELYKIAQHEKVNNILCKVDMENLYKDKFVKLCSVRSKYYDKIMLSSFERCPICGIGVVSNLDHYLAKSIYPTYAVTPINLIPICRDCNYNKNDTKVVSIISAPLHAYYDSVDNIVWLEATLQVINGQLVAQFMVSEDIALNNIALYKRLCNHIKLFNLNKAYSIRSSAEIADNYRHWIENYYLWGEEELMDFFKQQLISCEAYQINTWKTAFLRALISNISILKKL